MTYAKTEVKPQYGGYTILVTFKEDLVLPEVPKQPKRILGIDVGVSNLAAVANNFGDTPFLIKGGALKSMNQKFNKQRAKLLSAVTKGSDAWYLVRYAKEQRVDVIVIGHNEDQKQNICIGKQNNQNFVSIPFCQFIKILRNTAAKAGIPVADREES